VTDSKNYRVQKFSSSGTYVSQFGAMGSGPAKFSAPSGITLSNGVLAIADSGNNWVQEYGADGYILEFGSGVIGASSGLALTGGGQNLWIADTANNRLFSFTTDSEGVEGTWVQTVGSFGTGQVQFNAPHGLAVDRSNNLWVVDSGNNRLQQLSSTGTWLQSIGSKGVGDGQFKAPEFLALDSSGNLWIADTGNNRVEELNDSGTYVSQIGCSTGACAASSENGQFSKPTGIAVDATGNFWVGDCSNNRVQELGRDGAWLQTIGGLAAGSGNSQFSCPEGLAFDALGNLWVVDSGNNRVQEFSSSGAYLSQVGGGQENFNSPIAIAVH
jgi:sugar lactone lactonase YvrE